MVALKENEELNLTANKDQKRGCSENQTIYELGEVVKNSFHELDVYINLLTDT